MLRNLNSILKERGSLADWESDDEKKNLNFSKIKNKNKTISYRLIAELKIILLQVASIYFLILFLSITILLLLLLLLLLLFNLLL